MFFYGKFLSFSILFFGIHFLLNSKIEQTIPLVLLKKMHLFLGIITFAVLSTITFIKAKAPDYIGFGYLAFILVKMAISLVFIYPIIATKDLGAKVYILHFFSAFFLYLTLEVLLIIKEIKT